MTVYVGTKSCFVRIWRHAAGMWCPIGVSKCLGKLQIWRNMKERAQKSGNEKSVRLKNMKKWFN